MAMAQMQQVISNLSLNPDAGLPTEWWTHPELGAM